MLAVITPFPDAAPSVQFVQQPVQVEASQLQQPQSVSTYQQVQVQAPQLQDDAAHQPAQVQGSQLQQLQGVCAHQQLQVPAPQLQGIGAHSFEQQADIVLHPDVAEFGLLAWERLDEIIEAGYRYAMKELPVHEDKLKSVL